LFQPVLGTELITNFIGVDVNSIGTFVVPTGVVAALRSAITAGTNRFFLNNISTADSEFGASTAHFNDNEGIALGNTLAAPDVLLNWNGITFEFAFAANSGNLTLSNPGVDRFVINATTQPAELNINMESGFSLGAQLGANGNQFGNFVTAARTIGVAGDWADFLLTQAGSLTVGGLAMGRVSAWVINPVSYANSTGSVANADTLTVGGFPTSSPGVTITERQSLFVIAGRSRHAAVMSYDPISPAALAAGTTQDYTGLLTGTANNGMRHLARLAGDAGGTSALGGIDATSAQDGDTFKLVNVSANNVTLNHQDAGSVAANRIISPTGANFVLGADESCEIYYDVTDTRWRILYGSGA
jgi:hypothetical protein